MIESRHLDQERAIKAALESSEPGDIVEIHADDCGTIALGDELANDPYWQRYGQLCPECGGLPTDDGPVCHTCGRGKLCSCTPITITVGPKA